MRRKGEVFLKYLTKWNCAMKIVLLSNYYSPHQKQLSEELYCKLTEDFSFISTSEMREERKKLGYDFQQEPRYVEKTYVDLFCVGDPWENRTPVTAVKGRCLSRLTNGPMVAEIGLEPMTYRV